MLKQTVSELELPPTGGVITFVVSAVLSLGSLMISCLHDTKNIKKLMMYKNGVVIVFIFYKDNSFNLHSLIRKYKNSLKLYIFITSPSFYDQGHILFDGYYLKFEDKIK